MQDLISIRRLKEQTVKSLVVGGLERAELSVNGHKAIGQASELISDT